MIYFFLLREIRTKNAFLVTGGLLDFGRHDILLLISLFNTVLKEGVRIRLVLGTAPSHVSIPPNQNGTMAKGR